MVDITFYELDGSPVQFPSRDDPGPFRVLRKSSEDVEVDGEGHEQRRVHSFLQTAKLSSSLTKYRRMAEGGYNEVRLFSDSISNFSNLNDCRCMK